MVVDALHGRPKVLLLGISYPCVASQMEKHGFDPSVLTSPDGSVEQAVECVRRGILTEMDARDLARCVATEKAMECEVYTVSKEIGAVYREDRHVHANFNARNFSNTLLEQFGKGIQFSQVILDYYWMPTGWLVTRWAKTLFQQTLPELAKNQMLKYPTSSRRGPRRRQQASGMDEGVVYLPFCAHVCKELVGGIHILEQYYAISFLHKKDLKGHALWKGTMEIDAQTMQTRLGKRLDQEEVYCTFRPKDIYESMEDPHVSKSSVMKVLLAIEDYNDIRMVRLRPLAQHERASVFRERLSRPEVGGFQGLNFALARQRQLAMSKGRKPSLTNQGDKTAVTKPKSSPPKAKPPKTSQPKSAKKTPKPTKPKPVNTKKRKFEATKVVRKDPVYEDVEESTLEELKRFTFYPGPTRNLATYDDPKQAAQTDRRLCTRSSKRRRTSSRNATPTQSESPVVRAAIVSDSDGDKPKQTNRFLPPTEYLAFNPRNPPPTPAKNKPVAAEELQLDWSIPADVETEESDTAEGAAGARQTEKVPVYHELEGASTLFFGVRKQLNDDAVEQVCTIREEKDEETGALVQRHEPTCFVMELNKSSGVIGYKPESQESLQDTFYNEDSTPAFQAAVEACRGDWGGFLDKKDRYWLAKFKASPTTPGQKRKGDRKTKSQDVVVANVIDRVQNLTNIIKWIVCGRSNLDDPTGCLRMIDTERRQLKNTQLLSSTALRIEGVLNRELMALSVDTEVRTENSSNPELLRAVESYQLHYQSPDVAIAALTKLRNSEKEDSSLVRGALRWLHDKNDKNDVSGHFGLVDKTIPAKSGQDLGSRAKEVALVVEIARNMIKYQKNDPPNSPRKPQSDSERDFVYSLTLLGDAKPGGGVARREDARMVTESEGAEENETAESSTDSSGKGVEPAGAEEGVVAFAKRTVVGAQGVSKSGRRGTRRKTQPVKTKSAIKKVKSSPRRRSLRLPKRKGTPAPPDGEKKVHERPKRPTRAGTTKLFDSKVELPVSALPVATEPDNVNKSLELAAASLAAAGSPKTPSNKTKSKPRSKNESKSVSLSQAEALERAAPGCNKEAQESKTTSLSQTKSAGRAVPSGSKDPVKSPKCFKNTSVATKMSLAEVGVKKTKPSPRHGGRVLEVGTSPLAAGMGNFELDCHQTLSSSSRFRNRTVSASESLLLLDGDETRSTRLRRLARTNAELNSKQEAPARSRRVPSGFDSLVVLGSQAPNASRGMFQTAMDLEARLEREIVDALAVRELQLSFGTVPQPASNPFETWNPTDRALAALGIPPSERLLQERLRQIQDVSPSETILRALFPLGSSQGMLSPQNALLESAQLQLLTQLAARSDSLQSRVL